ncbi:MAG: hypothetical protein HY711_00105 [Candidatus Melainabacteria bacterium]|nr:hypothetical protein [Candidatus Melainabacteria bacterium]
MSSRNRRFLTRFATRLEKQAMAEIMQGWYIGVPDKLENVVRLRCFHQGSGHPDTGRSLYFLGDSQYLLHLDGKAEESYMAALAVLQAAMRNKRWTKSRVAKELFCCLAAYEHFLEDVGRMAQARRYGRAKERLRRKYRITFEQLVSRPC